MDTNARGGGKRGESAAEEERPSQVARKKSRKSDKNSKGRCDGLESGAAEERASKFARQQEGHVLQRGSAEMWGEDREAVLAAVTQDGEARMDVHYKLRQPS